MKRSEFGFDEWSRFYVNVKHTHLRHCYVHTVTIEDDKNKYSGTHSSLDEACRICVEEFCKGYPRDFPWDDGRPNFVSWTQERCEKFISCIDGGALINTRKDTRTNNIPATSLCVAFKNLHANFGSDKIGPTLKDWQDAALWVWEQVNK